VATHMRSGTSVSDIVSVNQDRMDRGYTPNADWYCNEDLHRLEIQRIFNRNWQLVGTSADVERPGQYFTTSLDELQEFIVMRGQDGKLRGFRNVCPHRANALLDGAGKVANIQCSYHGWTFALDGKLKAVPGADQSDIDTSGCDLRQVSVGEWAPFIFLNPDPHASPLEEHLGEIPALVAALGIDMPAVARQKNIKVVDSILECNWKVAVENSLECYHCPTSHPGFRETVDLPNWQIDVRGACIVQGTHMRPQRRAAGGQPGEVYRDGDSFAMGTVATEVALSEKGMDLAWFHWLFPNNSISVWPGPGNSFNVARWIPLGPNRTRWWSIRWWPQDVSDAARDEQWDFIVQVGWEDKKIVENIQRGMRSGGWSGGPFKIDRASQPGKLQTARDERGPQQFNRLVAKALQA
jgi:phenylpropionate dioxygenase-like ring-hydroxylating dioxygenase large terminal subunit